MKKKFALILAGVLIVVGIIAATYIFQFQKSNDISPKSSEVGFLYEEANSQLKNNLKLAMDYAYSINLLHLYRSQCPD